VRRWRTRFADKGVGGVGVIAAGRGPKPSIPAGTVEEVLRLTHKERPADGSTHRSTRSMAARVGIGKDTVAKIWADHEELKPWKVDTFTISNDPAAAASNLPPPSSDSARREAQASIRSTLTAARRSPDQARAALAVRQHRLPPCSTESPSAAERRQLQARDGPRRPSRRPEVVQLRLR
jgi:hypothetical protein